MKYTYIYKKNKQNKNLSNSIKKHNHTPKKHNKTPKKYKHKSINHKTNSKNNKKKLKKMTQKGGSTCTKEKFEVHSIKNFDYDKYKLLETSNVDWSTIGGPPPEPNCCIC